MTAGPGLFSRSPIRFIEPSLVLRRWPIISDAHCLGSFLIGRLLLASPGSSDALRILIFTHGDLRATNPPVTSPFRSVHLGSKSSASLLTTVFFGTTDY